jgi:sensor domain CHASE-containing protein
MNSAPRERRFVAGGVSSRAAVLRVVALGSVWLLLAAAGSWWMVFLPAQRMDVRAAEREADICEGFLQTEMARLRATSLDWANWDELERYLQNPEEKFAVENVTQSALRNLDIDGMLLVKSDGDLQRREVTGVARSLYMGSANFLERIASLRARASEKGAAAAMIGNAGHLYIVAVAPVLGTDAKGPSSGEVIIFRLVTDADLSNHQGVKGANVVLLPADVQPIQTNLEGKTGLSSGVVVTRAITGPDGAEVALLQVYHNDTHAELARRAVLFSVVAGVLLAVGVFAVGAVRSTRYLPARR